VVAGNPGEKATIKTFTRKGTKIVLVPANDALEPMTFDEDEVAIFGRS
jgi:repressor LexA